MPDQKASPNFGNVQSGGSSTEPVAPVNPTSIPTPPASHELRTYTVVSGDNLSAIAKKLYGKSSKWKAIFEANRDTVKDPDLIRPGQVLKIPADEKETPR